MSRVFVRSALLGTVVAACSLCVTTRAFAQSDVLLDRFQPPPPGEYFAGLPFPRYNGDYYVVFRAGTPVRTTFAPNTGNTPAATRVTTQTVLHQTLFLGVHNSFAFHFDIPSLLHNWGPSDPAARSARWGDPSVGLRFRVVNVPSRSPWSLHLAGQFFFPAFWFNGIADTQFTGVSDGTARGNIGAVFAGSVGLHDDRPPAVSKRFFYSIVAEENVRASANALRPGSETHVAAGIGVLRPQTDGVGFRVTLEGHTWWAFAQVPDWRNVITAEGVLGAAIRLPQEFEITSSVSVASGVHGEGLVRAGPVIGFTIGIAYAIRDWAGFPLAFDPVAHRHEEHARVRAGGCGRRRNDAAQQREDDEHDRARDFGMSETWDRDCDGIPDDVDPCPDSTWRPGDGTRAGCGLETDRDRGLAAQEASVVRDRRGDVLHVEGARLPVALDHPLVARVPEAVNAVLQFQNDVDIARMARTVTSAATTRSDAVTFFAVVRLENTAALHPVLAASTALRRVWLERQIQSALHRAGAHGVVVQGITPSPCPAEDPVGRTCIFAAVYPDANAVNASEAREATDALAREGVHVDDEDVTQSPAPAP